MNRRTLIGYILGGACLGAAIAVLALGGRDPAFGKRNVRYFVMEVGKTVSMLGEGGRELGETVEVWAEALDR